MRVLVLAVCVGGLRLVECAEGPRLSRVVRAGLGLGLDVYIIVFISTVTVVLSLSSID